MIRKLLAREAKSLLQLIAQSKPFDWIATGALVIKKVIWRPWPGVTAMVIGGGAGGRCCDKVLLSLKAAKDGTSGEE